MKGKSAPQFSQYGIIPFQEETATDDECILNFSSPNIFLGQGNSSPRNAIEKHFSINLDLY
jgi:hypothetical protein